jgi:hypothetical protein
MKRACLLIVVPALLVALGFAQTPTASSNAAPTSIRGCLGGSDGNYTLAEDNTGHNFKLAPGSVDLKPFLGQSVALIGLKASSGAADNSFAVTEAKMVSEHCAAATAAPAASISTPADTTVTPTVATAATAATVPAPADTASAPVADAAAPAAAVNTPPQPEVTPAAAAAAPPAAGPTPTELASAPAAAAAPPPASVTPPVKIVEASPVAAGRSSARSRRPSATHAAAATTVAAAPPAETTKPAAEAATPAATAGTPAATATEPDPAAPAPAPAVPAKSGSLLWIPIVVVVLILGAMVPLFNRWRKRRLLERTGEENLSFSHRASSEPGTSNKPTGRKAA